MDYFDIKEESLKHYNKKQPITVRDIIAPAIIFIIIFIVISAGLLINSQFLSGKNIISMLQFTLYVLPIFMAVSLTNSKNGVDISILGMIYLCQLILVANPTPYFNLIICIIICAVIGAINGLLAKNLGIPVLVMTLFSVIVLFAFSFLALANKPYLLDTYLPHKSIWLITGIFVLSLALLLTFSQKLWSEKTKDKSLPIIIVYAVSGVFTAFFALNAVSFAPIHFSPLPFINFSFPMISWLFAITTLMASKLFSNSPTNIVWAIITALMFILVYFFLKMLGVSSLLYSIIMALIPLAFIAIGAITNRAIYKRSFVLHPKSWTKPTKNRWRGYNKLDTKLREKM